MPGDKIDYEFQIEQAKLAAKKWRKKNPIVGVGDLRVDLMVGSLIQSISELLACARAEEDRAEKAENCLKEIEKALGENFSLNRLRELVEADRDGQCVIVTKCHDCKKHIDVEGKHY